MKHIIYILSLSLIGFTSCDYISEVQFKNAIIEGNNYADSSKNTLAINQFVNAREYNDSSFVSYYNAGNILLEERYFDSTFTNYRQALAYSSDSTELSNIYYQIGNTNLTIHEFKEEEINNNLAFLDSINQIEDKTIQTRIRLNIAKDSLLKMNDSILKEQGTILNNAKLNYINSLGYNYRNDSAQYNYIYTLYLIKKEEESKNQSDDKDEEKKEPTKFALKQKEKALSLIKNNKFKAAYTLLKKALETDKTVENFNELIGKLKDINEIIDKNEK